MCRQVKCDKCGKPSWAGCGAHVEQVLGHVPKAERCACRETASAGGGGGIGASIRKLFGG
jgi:hypothetical protein